MRVWPYRSFAIYARLLMWVRRKRIEWGDGLVFKRALVVYVSNASAKYTHDVFRGAVDWSCGLVVHR